MVPLLAARLSAARRHADDGFSLAETLVALGIAVVSLLGLLGTSVFAVKATVGARQAQQAGDLMNAALEKLRSLDYGGLAMVSANVAATADPQRTGSGTVSSPYEFNPGGGSERLDVRAGGAVNPYVVTQQESGTTYTIKRYVTLPENPDGTPAYTTNAQGVPSVRRVTVRVEWRDKGQLRVRTVGTLMTQTRRGLPLPHYRFTYNGPATVLGTTAAWTKNPGNTVDYGFVLQNLGATDSWLISASSGTWAYHVDTDQDGLYDAGEPALANGPTAASSSCACWTGTITAGAAPLYIVATRTIPTTEPEGTTTTTFSATSVASPSHPAKTVTTQLTVTNGVVVAPTALASASPTPTPTASSLVTALPTSTASPLPCTAGVNTATAGGTTINASVHNDNQFTITRLTLHNGTTSGDTATQAVNFMNQNTTRLPAACNYSTDLQTGEAGRRLHGTGTGSAVVARWHFPPPSDAQDQYKGTAVLRVWVQCVATATPTLTVRVGVASGSNFDTFTQDGSNGGGNGSVTMSSCDPLTFRQVDIPYQLSANGFSVDRATERLAVRLTTNHAVRLLYDTAGAHGAFEIGMR